MPGRPPIPHRFPEGDADVRLRRMTAADLDWLIGFETDPAAVGEHNWAGPLDPDEVRARVERRLQRDGLIGTLDGQLLVEVRTDACYVPAGTVGWHPRHWGPQDGSVGLVLGFALHPDFRGRGVGLAAHQLLVDLLFRVTGVHRIEADTAVDNPAEVRCLERAGFRREGTIRGAELRNGEYVDHLLYAILRDEYRPVVGS